MSICAYSSLTDISNLNLHYHYGITHGKSDLSLSILSF